MTVPEILIQLQSLALPAVRDQHIKRGANKDVYGVKMGDIRPLAKKIKLNAKLGKELWATGNMEAQLLAALIIKPKELSEQDLEEMAGKLESAQVADWFNSYLLKDHASAEALREKWMDDANPFKARSGWSLTAGRIARNPEGLNLNALLKRLAEEMPKAPDISKWTMNTALAYIGIHHPELRFEALRIGEKLGIYKDYPVAKGCTSPYAPIWINEMVKRQEA